MDNRGSLEHTLEVLIYAVTELNKYLANKDTIAEIQRAGSSVGEFRDHVDNLNCLITDVQQVLHAKNLSYEEIILKQAILENILDRHLTSREINDIKADWAAFYGNPEEYRDSIVVVMVNKYLNERKEANTTSRQDELKDSNLFEIFTIM